MGGVSEFVSSVCVILSFNAALSANINQGIAASIVISNVGIVSVLSYCTMGEAVSKTQLFGMTLIIGAVALVSLDGPGRQAG